MGAGRQRLPEAGAEVGGGGPAVLRQVGKVANCQAGMFLAYVSPMGRALVDKGFYLPESWTSDDSRCAAAGVPEDKRRYRSKTELALEMLALERGHLKAGWVAGDDAFGMSRPSGTAWRPWGCATSWTFRGTSLFGRWIPSGPCIPGIRASPQVQAAERAAAHSGGARC